MTEPVLDVIVPVYNSPDIEDRCIRYLLTPGALPPNARLIVVDDASPDLTTFNTYSKVLPALGHVFHRRPENGGCHASWNTGISLSRPEADIALIGSDVVVGIGTLFVMHYAAHELNFAIVAPREVTAKEWDAFHYHELLTKPTNTFSGTAGCGLTACCVVRREAIDAVGPFDERFRVTFGDTDWTHRAKDAGFTGLTLHEVQVFHGISVSRKRVGMDADLSQDMKDHKLFMEKWHDREDVLELHRASLSKDDALKNKVKSWASGER